MEVLGAGFLLAFLLVWWILQIIGNWKIFEKAGIPGWHSIIPILNIYDEYSIGWKGSWGILMFVALVVANSITPAAAQSSGTMMIVAGIAALIVICCQVVESFKLAAAFGHGVLYGLFLLIFDRLGRIVLGFGSSEYVGNRRR